MISLFFAASLAANPASVDLGGGSLSVRVDNERGVVRIGKHELSCEGEPCEVELLDIKRGDGSKELALCSHGPRDERYCVVYRLHQGKLEPIAMPEGSYIPSIATTGGGFVLVTDNYRQRLYERVDKLTYADGRFTRVPQPIYSAPSPVEMKVDRTFKLQSEAGGGVTIANTRPDSTIQVLGEHGSKEGWMLVRLSSGITGWVKALTLAEASDHYMMVMGAG